jgi:hypothetical protein
MIDSNEYFSNDTYSVLYKLVNNNTIEFDTTTYFSPLRILFGDGSWGKASGGLDYEGLKKFNFSGSIHINFDLLANYYHGPIKSICKMMIAVMLAEGIILYDYYTKGAISNSDLVKKWYSCYFDLALNEVVKRSIVDRRLAQAISETYGKIVFEKITYPMLSGISPRFRLETDAVEDEDNTVTNVFKGNKEVLGKVFKSFLKPHIADLSDDIRVDYQTRQDVFAFNKAFGEFATYLYNNRKTKFKPSQLEDMPTSSLSDMLYNDQARAANKAYQGYQTYVGKQRSAGLKPVCFEDWFAKNNSLVHRIDNAISLHNLPKSILLALKAVVNRLMGNCKDTASKYNLGFGGIAKAKIFDNAYKITLGLDDMYERNLYPKSTYIYAELYMPSIIISKYLFYHIRWRQKFDKSIMNLVDMSLKGLQEYDRRKHTKQIAAKKEKEEHKRMLRNLN